MKEPSGSLTEASAISSDPFLRVKAEKVTQLLDLVGELGLAVAAVTRRPAMAGLDASALQNDIHRLENLVRETQDLASSLRLVPVGQAFRRMQRVVRDLLHETGKAVDLTLVGEEVELDKLLIDQLNEPLLHLIRNSVDHGLESPAERRQAGKPEHGRITLKAIQVGREIQISVSDDGRGLNRQAILRRARQQGLLGENDEPADQELWSFIFKPGFSTAEKVSKLSGRGVGMDVVQTTVNALRGRVLVHSEAGRGACFTLAIPLTLAFLDCLIVRARRRLFAIPIDNVQEVFEPAPGQALRASADGSTVMDWRSGVALVEQIASLYGETDASQALDGQVVVMVGCAGRAFGLPVDEVIGQQQVVIKPLKGFFKEIRGGIGCALLNNGEVAVALDAERLLNGGKPI